MIVLQRKLDLFLKLFWQLIIAVNHIRVAFAGLIQILNLLRSDTSPTLVSTCLCRNRTLNPPVAVLPTRMVLDGDLNGKAQFTLRDLYAIIFAGLDLAHGAVVGRNL